MQIELLREYIALAQTLSFSQAAERMHVSQSTLSRHLASLEEEVGALLIERSTRKVRLSRAGEVFLREGLQAVQAFDDLMLKTRQSAPLDEGKLSIAYPYYYANSYLSAPLDLFNSMYPNIAVSLTPIQPQEVEGALTSGSADVSIDARYPFQKDTYPHLISHAMGSEGFCVCVAEASPLAAKDYVEPVDLMSFPVVSAEQYAPHRDFVEAYLALAGIQPPKMIYCNNVELIYSQVISNNAIAFRMDESGNQPHPGVRYVPLLGNLQAQVRFVARAGNPNPAVAHFFGMLQQHF